MKKKILYLFVLALSTLGMQAGISKAVHCSSPGGLSNMTIATYDEIKDLTDLTITGDINVSDFLVLQNFYNLKRLDISGVLIHEYNGYDGTLYAANCIPPKAFMYMSLESVRFPTNLTGIGGSAFLGCQSLTELKLPDGFLTLGYAAFKYCTSLSRIELPVSLKEIGATCFAGCTALDSVNLVHLKLDSLNMHVFNGCIGLSSVRLPSTLSKLDESLFSSCKSLKNIELPQGLKIIANTAFSTCDSLSSINIPSSVDSIGSSAFMYCFALKNIYLQRTEPVRLIRSYGVFDYVDKNACILHVPVGTKATYSQFSDWYIFKNIVEDIPSRLRQTDLGHADILFDRSAGMIRSKGLDLAKLFLFDCTGRLMGRTGMIRDASLSTEGLPKGIYMVRLEGGILPKTATVRID